MEVIETVKAKGWVPYYAVKTVFREIGELLSVFIISTNKDDMQMWGEDREWLRKGYALTYTHNFTYDFAECGDVVFRIAAGGAVRER